MRLISRLLDVLAYYALNPRKGNLIPRDPDPLELPPLDGRSQE